ncbi:hypothetical protein [Caulobacter sp. DWR1-3-2b1]|uniref:hypothetical protein n=1 Tax=Caulobacter sp. DWR1-3-2b1 TaxID=2804670 RepID=UPI003CF03E1A
MTPFRTLLLVSALAAASVAAPALADGYPAELRKKPASRPAPVKRAKPVTEVVYVDRVIEKIVYVERDCDCGPRHDRRRDDSRGASGAVISDETYESESSRYEESSESRSSSGATHYGGNQSYSTRYGPGGGWLPRPVETAPIDYYDPPYIGGGYVGRPSGGRGGGYYGGVVGGSGGGWAGGFAGASARSSAAASASSSVNIRVGGGGHSGCGGGCGGGGGKRY